MGEEGAEMRRDGEGRRLTGGERGGRDESRGGELKVLNGHDREDREDRGTYEDMREGHKRSRQKGGEQMRNYIK